MLVYNYTRFHIWHLSHVLDAKQSRINRIDAIGEFRGRAAPRRCAVLVATEEPSRFKTMIVCSVAEPFEGATYALVLEFPKDTARHVHSW